MKRAKAGTVIGCLLAAGTTIFLLSAVVAGSAAKSGPALSGETACEGFAYTVDNDPRGTNVRSAPSRTAPVLFALLPSNGAI